MLRQYPSVILVDPRYDSAFDDDYLTVRYVRNVAASTRERPFHVRLVTKDRLVALGAAWVAWERGDCVLAIDEVHEFCPSSHLGIPPIIKTILLQGRHRNVGFFAASQRPANVHNDILSEASCGRMHVFRLGFGRDLDYMRGWVPDIERVTRFQLPGEHITWPENSA